MKIDIFDTNKKYQIIYADPPWNFDAWSKKGDVKSVKNHYGTMKSYDIKALPVKQLADDNCVLFMWVTFPTIREAFSVIDAWGFTYKTCAFTWIKINKKSSTPFWGMGYWTRSNAEICLLATKGSPKRVSAAVHQVIFSPVEQHSKKPDEARERIVKLCGDIPRIELFARQAAESWDCWGLEAPDD